MTIFKSAKVTELEERVTALEADNAKLTADLAAAGEVSADQSANLARIAELETANAEIPVLNQAIADHVATIGTQAAEIATLTASNVVTAAKISEQAAIMLAANGHGAPLNLSGEKPDGESKTEIKNLTGFAKASAAFASKKA